MSNTTTNEAATETTTIMWGRSKEGTTRSSCGTYSLHSEPEQGLPYYRVMARGVVLGRNLYLGGAKMFVQRYHDKNARINGEEA